jgi:hypothetical protein
MGSGLGSFDSDSGPNMRARRKGKRIQGDIKELSVTLDQKVSWTFRRPMGTQQPAKCPSIHSLSSELEAEISAEMLYLISKSLLVFP